MNCLKKSKTLLFIYIISYDICLLIDRLRYPLVGYLGTLILIDVEFIFKYLAVIMICEYFIKRSGQLVKKEE